MRARPNSSENRAACDAIVDAYARGLSPAAATAAQLRYEELIDDLETEKHELFAINSSRARHHRSRTHNAVRAVKRGMLNRLAHAIGVSAMDIATLIWPVTSGRCVEVNGGLFTVGSTEDPSK